MTTQLQDRFRGIMLGLACGDALGAQVEFAQRDTFPEQRDMTGAGPHRLKPGQWTDDTAMALLLSQHMRGDSLCEDGDGLARLWLDWYLHGVGSCTGKCFDIGNQTRQALLFWRQHGDTKAWPEEGTGRGNGALMRVAPVALALCGASMGKVALAATNQAIVTHSMPAAGLCADFALLLVGILGGASQGCSASDLQDVVRRAFPTIAKRKRKDVVSSGYDVATFEAAVWAVCGAADLEDAIVRAVNLGDDADTVGAVAGALAGAVWGASEIPSRWLKPLAWGDRIMAEADYWYGRTRDGNR